MFHTNHIEAKSKCTNNIVVKEKQRTGLRDVMSHSLHRPQKTIFVLVFSDFPAFGFNWFGTSRKNAYKQVNQSIFFHVVNLPVAPNLKILSMKLIQPGRISVLFFIFSCEISGGQRSGKRRAVASCWVTWEEVMVLCSTNN